MHCQGCTNCNTDPNKSKTEQIINGGAYALMCEIPLDEAKDLLAVLADEKNQKLFYQKFAEYLLAKEERNGKRNTQKRD